VAIGRQVHRSPAPVLELRPEARARRARACRKKFLEYFPDGFRDETYVETERAYKWDAHRQWESELGRDGMENLLRRRAYTEIATRAVRIESRTNLLFSFEKMALRDAVSDPAGARRFASGLARWLYGADERDARFTEWCNAVRSLPRRQTRVLTWPIVTVFGFVARPRSELFLKPNVMRRAAAAYGFDLRYASTPQVETYRSLLDFARRVRHDLRDLRPRDMIDIQSFLWVQGSDEYA
jgi:hypothetical protein